MNETSMPYVVIVTGKCPEGRKAYGIRAETHDSSHWLFNWAFPIKEDSAKREGYDKATIRGQIDIDDDFPGCPYCGAKKWVVCACGHISCLPMGAHTVTCQWCGLTGKVEAYDGNGIQAGADA